MDAACCSTTCRPQSLRSAALTAVLAGIVVGVGLASVALVAQGHLQRRLSEHDINLARALAAFDDERSLAADVKVPSNHQTALGRAVPRAPSTGNGDRAQRIRRQSDNCDNPAECQQLTGYDSALGLHAAHLTVASSGQRRIVLKEIDEGSGHITWNTSTIYDEYSIYRANASDIDELEWLVIPEDGVYFVYSQVTWWGRLTSERFTETMSRSLINKFVVRANNKTDDYPLAGMTTQWLGRCNELEHCHIDSSYVSGIVNLAEGSQIAVVADCMAAICTDPDKTFMGIFFLRQELQT